MELQELLHQTLCGAIAAAGFGVLFNISFRALPWCAGCGALALFLRTLCLNAGWSLEAASFLAAVAVSFAVQLLQVKADLSHNALDVAGCIPLVPGSFAAKAILGLFSLTSQHPAGGGENLLLAVEYSVRVTFTIGAIGTGLAIPHLLLRVRLPKQD